MGIRFILMVNKQGQTRLAQYYEWLTLEERRALEGEIVRKCLARNDQQCSFVEHRNYKIVYRRYASLFFLVGVDNDENELAILEFIHLLVETMDRHFGNVDRSLLQVSRGMLGYLQNLLHFHGPCRWGFGGFEQEAGQQLLLPNLGDNKGVMEEDKALL
ncbi:hypothetical protein H0E87_012574 [Populus deltoides]|uniref:AP complex mu/sigma subunit domain-containing protein n=1 Tax=Populus deltoides TaxID=3696 RepID=A0A8T2YJS9_POPDE|nr:hypothetical protein H0E87_012574 [Populus deltoides]